MTLEQIRDEINYIDEEVRTELAAPQPDMNLLATLQGRRASLVTVREVKQRALRNQTLAHRKAGKGEVA